MAPAGVRKHELIQPVRQDLARDADPEFIGDGEVQQAKAARQVFLSEEDLALSPCSAAIAGYDVAACEARLVEAFKSSSRDLTSATTFLTTARFRSGSRTAAPTRKAAARDHDEETINIQSERLSRRRLSTLMVTLLSRRPADAAIACPPPSSRARE